MKSKIIIVAFAIICLLTNIIRETEWKHSMFKYDISGYHLYLPAVFIYGDLKTLSFNEKLDQQYKIADVPWYGIVVMPDGSRINKYACGVAVMETPFFLAAHLYTTLNGKYPADGYSMPYEYGGIISNIFWSVLGLYYLRRLLRNYYSENIIAITLIAICFGTNLFFYNAFTPGMSHPYSFSLFSLALYYTDQWYLQYKRSDLYLAAIVIGILAITRPLNALFILVPLFWRVSNRKEIVERIQLFAIRWKALIIAFILFVFILLIQLCYWKYTSSYWLFYSYGKEPFLWDDPRIMEGLFGFRKGWFVYTPIAFVAMLGFYRLWKTDRRLVPTLVLFLCILIYATFSWWNWWYGGGFGARTLVDVLPVMAWPFAALTSYIYNQTNVIKTLFTSAILLLVILNTFQSYQAKKNIIHFDRMSWAYYRYVFGKLHIGEEREDLLLDERTYWNEFKRFDRK